jgi:hypothetical protein
MQRAALTNRARRQKGRRGLFRFLGQKCLHRLTPSDHSFILFLEPFGNLLTPGASFQMTADYLGLLRTGHAQQLLQQ